MELDRLVEAGAASRAVVPAGAGFCARFGSGPIAQPVDRLPQWTHRKKIAPGSHQGPYSCRPLR
ncbi:MAG: hypothetical protein IT176_02720 [Acidobacteria bacterium]|nr:hypothetical protein [Acidobacteriota bacterium]